MAREGAAELEREVARLRQRVAELETLGAGGPGERDLLSRYQHVISATDDAVSLVDDSYVYRIANEAYARRTGRAREDIIGHSVEEVLGSEVFQELVREKLDRCLQGETIRYRSWFAFPTAGRRFQEVTYSPLREQGSAVTGVLVNARDITEQEEARASVAASEERFRALAETAPVGVYLTDRDGRCTWVNRRWLEMAGMEFEEALGDGWIQGVHPEDRPQIRASWRQMVASEGRWGVTYRFLAPDGKVTEIYGLARPLRDPSGTVTGYVGINTDVSALREAQTAVRESEAKYRATVETQADGFLMLDREGRVLEVNDAYVRRSGYTREELLTRNIADLDADESREETAARVATAIREGNDLFETRHRAKDGTPWQVEVNTSYWPIAGGRFFSFVRDLNRRKRAEMLLRTRLRLSESAPHASLDEILQQALDAAEAITESRVGFFHFVDEDQIHLTLQTWSTNTLECMCKAQGKGLHYPVDSAGVWVDCIRARKPVIHNDYASLGYKKGLPPGHAPIIRELVVPVLQAGKVVAVMGVGNKAEDYTADDAEPVRQLASIVLDIAARKRAEERLRRSEERYRTLFEESPAAIWEEDFSAVAARLTELRQAGIEDLRGHLGAHPEEVWNLAALVRIVDLNRRSVEILGAASKSSVARDLPAYFSEASLAVFRDEIVALAEGQTTFCADIPIIDGAGADRLLDLR
ncbi:MAG: PAS domain S-box protein, partial [Proteobacteria bacterium]|nr:PAS domain S-box protein [Pseudomonadota bacterium]